MRPKKLYRYSPNHELETHICGADCAPQIIEQKPHGTLWRCLKPATHDRYGYDNRGAAEVEEVQETKREILRLYRWLDVLEGKTPGVKKKMPL